MKPLDVLIALLARLGAQRERDDAVLISVAELREWPAEAVAALKSQKLLVKARAAASVVCPGCERACVMPVQTVRGGPRGVASVVVCDKRSDINRVPLSSDQLTQWRCTAELVCGFIAESLGVRRSAQPPHEAGVLPIGMATGKKRSQMLALRVEGDVALVIGDKSEPLATLLSFKDVSYSVDAGRVGKLVDVATTADARYIPSINRREARKAGTQAIYLSWQKAYRNLKNRNPGKSDVWFSLRIAMMDIANGRMPDTIRKHMRK